MQNRAALGILYLCLGILIFSLQDAIIKAVSGEYPLTQVVATRCFVSAPILIVMVHFEAGLPALFAREFWALAGRALLLLLAYTSYYMAFPALPLADAVALYSPCRCSRWRSPHPCSARRSAGGGSPR